MNTTKWIRTLRKTTALRFSHKQVMLPTNGFIFPALNAAEKSWIWNNVPPTCMKLRLTMEFSDGTGTAVFVADGNTAEQLLSRMVKPFFADKRCNSENSIMPRFIIISTWRNIDPLSDKRVNIKTKVSIPLKGNCHIGVVRRCLGIKSDDIDQHGNNDGGTLATKVAADFIGELTQFQAEDTMGISRLDDVSQPKE